MAIPESNLTFKYFLVQDFQNTPFKEKRNNIIVLNMIFDISQLGSHKSLTQSAVSE